MIRCPKCGNKFPLQDGQAEGEWSDIISLLPSFGPHSRLVFEYVELFGVSPLRGRAKKILRLLKEMAALLGSEKFDFQKKQYAISKAGIVESLKVVCNKNLTQLENHNYLKKVMIDVATREQKELRDAQDKNLRKREQEHVREVAQEQEKAISAAEYKQKKRIDSLVDQIGKPFGARRVE